MTIHIAWESYITATELTVFLVVPVHSLHKRNHRTTLNFEFKIVYCVVVNAIKYAVIYYTPGRGKIVPRNII